MAGKGGSGGMIGAVVAATILAVGFFIAWIVFFAKANKLQTELTQAHADSSEIVAPGERNSDATRTLVDQAKLERKTLVAYLSESMRTSMRKVSGNERETVKTLDEKLAKVAGADTTPLLEVIKDRDSRIADLTKSLDEARATAQAAQADLQSEVGRVGKMVADQQATIASMEAELGKYKAEVEEYRKATGDTIGANNVRVDDIRRKATDDKASYEDRIAKLTQSNQILAGQLAELRGKTASSSVRANDPAALVDGRVVGVSPGENTAFIDLRREDRLVLGMTFEVYDGGTLIRPDAEGDYPKGKATLEVIRIGEDTSACRIVRETRGNPVVRGDAIANAIYDPRKSYAFVVAGDFDLTGDGVATSGERDEVSAIIAAWGGKTLEDITGATDFVVLGERPRLPPAPPPDAPIAVINEYIRLQRTALEYDRLFETARQTGIPVLNESRLYTLTGLR